MPTHPVKDAVLTSDDLEYLEERQATGLRSGALGAPMEDDSDEYNRRHGRPLNGETEDNVPLCAPRLGLLEPEPFTAPDYEGEGTTFFHPPEAPALVNLIPDAAPLGWVADTAGDMYPVESIASLRINGTEVQARMTDEKTLVLASFVADGPDEGAQNARDYRDAIADHISQAKGLTYAEQSATPEQS
jgi:hypothetical protein